MRRTVLAWTVATLCSLAAALAQDQPPMPPGGPFPPPGAKVWGDDLPAKRDVLVKADDNVRLAATFWPAKAEGGAGAVLLHMYGSDRSAWEPLVRPLRDRGVAVLAIDLRGHGQSAKQSGQTDLAPLVARRDPKLFAEMHRDTIAAVRWIVKDGKCDAARVALVGASVGCSIAIDAARRHPREVAAVLCMSPGANYLGLDTLAHLKTFPETTPLLLMVHRSEIDAGAQKIGDARKSARLLVYDDAAPAGADKGWAHGTRMFGKLPIVELTVASFVAARTGSKTDDVVLDGVIVADGPDADPWTKAADVALPQSEGSVRAFRVGRRVVFGGTAAATVTSLRFEVMVGELPVARAGIPPIGLPQVVCVDLADGHVLWSFGGMGSVPDLPGMGSSPLFGKTRPAMRVVRTEAGTAFEGEWTVPAMGERPGDDTVRLLAHLDRTPEPAPQNGMVPADPEHAVALPSR